MHPIGIVIASVGEQISSSLVASERPLLSDVLDDLVEGRADQPLAQKIAKGCFRRPQAFGNQD